MVNLRSLVVGAVCSGAVAVAVCRAGDWPQWGGTDGRNTVSAEAGLPETFTANKTMTEVAAAGPAGNVRWVAPLGGACYGNPTVAHGRVFVGTDDKSLGDDPRFNPTGGGLVKCFDEKSGKLLWQLVVPKRTGFSKELHYGFQHLGVCSSPLVDGGRAYVVTSAAEVVCLDVNGQADGNAGPYTDEGKYQVPAGGRPADLKPTDADIVWRYDLMKELNVCPHDATSCSVLVHGDLIYLSTSNGVDHPHTKMLNPSAPAMIALDKRTGKLAAVEDEQISSRVFHCQWSPPSFGTVNGRPLVFFGGADGICYAFDALDKAPADGSSARLKAVWTYDCNPPEYKTRDGKPIPYLKGDKRKKDSPNKNDGAYVGPSEIIGTPVFVDGRVYVATGQDPMHGRGRGILHCIDAGKTGDITRSGKVWSYDALDRTVASPSVAGGLLYIPDVAGRLHCLDVATGKPAWVHETAAETWGSALVADGKVYLGTQKMFWVLAAGREPKVLSKVSLGSPMYNTPVAANGTLYVASQRHLWAVAAKP